MVKKTDNIQNTKIYFGTGNFNHSLSINSVSDDYRKKMKICYEKNSTYFHEKWNSKELESCYKSPFNNSNYKISDVIEHSNYFDNQNILLGHTEIPQFYVPIYYNIPPDFDVNFYKNAIGNNDIKHFSDNDAKKHFMEFGLLENRLYKLPENFDVSNYKKYNNDLHILSDYEAKKHYLEYGIFEKRKYL